MLLLVERSRHAYGDIDDFMCTHCLSDSTGVVIRRIDQKLTGNATEFSAIKRAFDDLSDPRPVALMSLGMNASFLVGTNLDVVDAIVTVGEIPSNILTQAIGRTFRPRADRDNSRPMLMVKVFTGE